MKICVAIRESSTSDAVDAACRALAWADLVELRGDYIRDLDLPRLLADKPGPVIFTLRSRSEGGEFDGSERGRLETLLEAAQLGADYVDVEFSSFWKPVLEAVPRERVILSYHNFERVPPDLPSVIDSMAASGAGIVKVAARANRLSDNLEIAAALRRGTESNIRLCALAMGRAGIASRVLGPLWGSWMTYACLPGGAPTADGQIPADELVDSYRIRSIGESTAVYGVAGRPLEHSLSPRVHNAAFAARGMDAVYLPLECDDMDDLLRFEAQVPLQGISVTIPYKEEAHARARSLSVEADQTGAVNTYVRSGTGWHGENTDVDGFLRPLRRRLHLAGMRALVLGAGGAARAIVFALRSQGALTSVAARNADRARDLAARFGAEGHAWAEIPHLDWDLLVNTTPVGMHPRVEDSPVPAEWLKGKWVYDLVYNPKQTRLLQLAAKKGISAISGAEMFLGQAIKQQQLWCGSLPPDNAMRDALESALGK